MCQCLGGLVLHTDLSQFQEPIGHWSGSDAAHVRRGTIAAKS
jgi:hypothetical protein